MDGERKLFTGGAADFVGDIKALADAGVTSFDFGMFGPTLAAPSTTCAASVTRCCQR